MNWVDSIPPLSPINLKAERNSSDIVLSWDTPPAASDGEYPEQYIVYRFESSSKININNPENILAIINSSTRKFEDKETNPGNSFVYVVTSLDRLQNESAASATVE